MSGGATSDRHVELYVRSLRPRETVTADAMDAIEELGDTGVVDTHEVVVWGKRAPRSVETARSGIGRYVCGRLAIFGEWARRNGASLEPALATERVSSEITGETYESIRLPQVCLAVYTGEALELVAPHSVDGDVRTVQAALERLPGQAVEEFVPVEGAREDTGSPVPRSEPAREAVISDDDTGGQSERDADLPLNPSPESALHPSGESGTDTATDDTGTEESANGDSDAATPPQP